MTLEMILPGFFFLWIGIACLMNSFVLSLIPLGILFQFILFALFTFLSMYMGRKMYTPKDNTLGIRYKEYIGQELILTSPIVNGHGRIHFNGTLWGIQGIDMPEGTHVRIIGIRNNMLHVVPSERDIL